MDLANLLLDLINNPEVQSFLASEAIGIGWGTVKSKFQKQPSWEGQALDVIRDTFEEFYNYLGWDYVEESVMDAFLDSVRNVEKWERELVLSEIISNTIGQKITKQQYEEWLKIFRKACSNPQYQWFYNEMTFRTDKQVEKMEDTAWMDQYMQGNFCEIRYSGEELLNRVFEDLETTLPQGEWIRLRALLLEVIYNAEDHGHANNCVLKIEENSITLVDDGQQFDVLSLGKQEKQRGGTKALEMFMKADCRAFMRSEYIDGKNHFIVEFPENVFSVNELSEIIVLHLTRHNATVELKYPIGDFKYYYLDIDHVPKSKDQRVFISLSSAFDLVDELRRVLSGKQTVEKIFIYCPKREREDYQYVYEVFEYVIEEWKNGSFQFDVELVQ